MPSFDLKVTESIQKAGVPVMEFWWYVARFGLYFYGAVLLGLAYFLNEKHRLFVIALPVLVTLAVTFIIQRIVRRRRPVVTKTTYDLWMHTYSFPSGHSSISFAFATSLSILFLNSHLAFSWIYAVVFFVAAFLIAVSRIVVGVHYFYDVLMGALIGIFVSVTLSGLLV